MEDISKQQIARLVLGYLKNENYHLAYNCFYKQCTHFDKYRQKRLKISTRYNGLSLEDVLLQYSEIYCIVQPRLEETDYFEKEIFEPHKLSKQLLYLLNDVHCKRASTPRTCSSLQESECNLSMDLTTTPLINLPGNIEESFTNKRIKKTSNLQLMQKHVSIEYPETETEGDDSSSGETEKAIVGEYVEVIRESILASEELQEKIAHTINEVQNLNATTEFDTVVQAILNRTESDPVFENLVEEILGTAPNLSEKEIPNKTTPKGLISLSTPSIKSPHLSQFNSTLEGSVTLPPPRKEEPVMVEQGVQVPEKRLKTILPVRRSKEQENITNYITLYKSDANEKESLNNTDVDGSVVAPNSCLQTSHSSLSLEKLKPPEASQSGNSEIGMLTDNKTPEPCLSSKKAPTPSQRSGNRSSHVRALDFKFQTPAKDSVKMTPSSSQSPKIHSSRNKSINCQKSSKSLFDAENTWTSAKADPQPNENSNKLVGKKLEIPSPNENIDSSNQSDKKPKLPPKLAAKKAVAQLTKNKNAKRKTSTSPCAINAEKTNETTPIANKKSRNKVVCTSGNGDNDSNAVELINANKPAAFKRKCNIEGKKDAQLKVFRALKDAEVIAEGDKLVLSPSKLNGNKRSLVGMDVPIKVPLITPDAAKIEPAIVPSASTIRNILPFLQTPAKDVCPKTPGTYDSGTNVDTPLTKVFNEHMSGIDISSIPTPKIMCTPSFPFTPLLEANETPSSNRPTDYSTSSSYYQPSDTEQCKSIETLIQECERLESNNKERKTVAEAEPKGPEVANAKIAEKIKSMATNVIARKNLNLMKSDKDAKSEESNTSDSSSSSDSDSSGSSDSSFSPSDDDEDNENAIIENSENSRYSLRARSANTSENKTENPIHKTPAKVSSKPKEEKTIIDIKDQNPTSSEISRNNQCSVKEIVNTVEYIPHLSNDTLKSGQKTKLLSDLDEIKMRVLQGIKNEDCGKRKKAVLPPATKKKSSARVLRSNVVVPNEINLSSSSSDEDITDKVQPFEIVEAELCSDSNTPLSLLKEEGQLESFIGTISNSKNSDKEESILNKYNNPRGASNENTNKVDQKKSKKVGEKPTRKVAEKPEQQSNKLNKKSPARQTVSERKSTKSASKVTKEPPQPRRVKSETSTKKKNETASKTKDKTDHLKSTSFEVPKKNGKDDKSTVSEKNKIDAPISTPCEKPSSEQESNANDALSWFLGRGINLMQNPNKVTKEPSLPLKEHKEKSSLNPLEATKYDKVIDYPETENISHCLVNIYSNEDDLIYFDTKVFTEPLLCIDRQDDQYSTKKRDLNDDNKRLAKAYEVKVYDDAQDAEITKLLHVSPFESLFDYHYEPVENVNEQSKVKVLNSVIVKRTPLDILYRSLVSPVKETNVQDDERRFSPLDNLYPTNPSTKTRFARKSNIETSVSTTKTLSNDNKNYLTTTNRAVNDEASFKISDDRPRNTEKTDKDKKRKGEVVSADEETDGNKKFKFDDLKLLKEAQVEHVLEQMYNS